MVQLVPDAWLYAHPNVAAAIAWQPEGGSVTAWPSWTGEQKADLRQAFQNLSDWHDSGMMTYAGAIPPDPPDLLVDPDPMRRAIVSTDVAWTLYTAQVAQCLAAEIKGWLPYSIVGYSDLALQLMFGCQTHFMPSTGAPGAWQNFNVPGGYLVYGNLTPSHPTYVFKWLSENGLIGTSAVDTITRVLGWCRNLSHISGPLDDPNQYYWRYGGPPPVRYIIDGTVCTDPNYPPEPPMHWTAGCGGTSAFLVSALLPANVAVQALGLDGGHQSPYFIAQSLYLSHGDDPYDGVQAAPPPLLPIDDPTFQDWFRTGNDKAAGNVGRQASTLGVDYPGDSVVRAYCTDLAKGNDHASGQVYASFTRPPSAFYPDPHFFTVAELEAAGLWTRLDALASARGLLGPRIGIRDDAFQSIPSGGARTVASCPAGQTLTDQFALDSSGTAALSDVGITFSALQNVNAWVSQPPPAVVAPTAEVLFYIAYAPATAGPFSFVMTVASSDPTCGSYAITVSGTAV